MGKNETENNKASQLEDKALKSAAQFFGQDLLPFLGFKGKVLRVAATEHVHLEVRRLEEDFNFILKDGSWLHLEFESDRITVKDLRRFREYEAYIGMVCNLPVATMVLCSASASRFRDELINGRSIYRVQVMALKERKAEHTFDRLYRRREKGKAISRRHLVPLMVVPLMSGKMPLFDRISQAVDILRWEELDITQEERRRLQSVVYALAVKFLKDQELNKIKERIGMTVLGQMLWDDGKKEGIELGIEKGIEKGTEQGEERIASLMQILLKEKRYEDLERASEDREYRGRLLRELGL